jgi:hypothetical protein
VVPFRLQYALGRRDRLAVEVTPHLPALAAALGFASGISYLGLCVSAWFFVLLLLPLVVCRGLIAFVADVATVAARPVDILVEADRLGFLTPTGRVWLDLDGVIQVYGTGRNWTLLHLNGSVLTIPADAIQTEQVEFLKAFALRGWRERQRHAPAV